MAQKHSRAGCPHRAGAFSGMTVQPALMQGALRTRWGQRAEEQPKVVELLDQKAGAVKEDT